MNDRDRMTCLLASIFMMGRGWPPDIVNLRWMQECLEELQVVYTEIFHAH